MSSPHASGVHYSWSRSPRGTIPEVSNVTARSEASIQVRTAEEPSSEKSQKDQLQTQFSSKGETSSGPWLCAAPRSPLSLPRPVPPCSAAGTGRCCSNEVRAGPSPPVNSAPGLRCSGSYRVPREDVNPGEAASSFLPGLGSGRSRSIRGQGLAAATRVPVNGRFSQRRVGGVRGPSSSRIDGSDAYLHRCHVFREGARTTDRNTPGGPGCRVGRGSARCLEGIRAPQRSAPHLTGGATRLGVHMASTRIGQNQGQQHSRADDRGVQSTLRVRPSS
ncbi:hypothetical protein NDU88_006912 [Pleurodeles waltl]|uniref:Uncharacterized protein n=1 Tax=Pleurodeles waltl TaxID=8319 RepID=A0AAV7QJ40_PLEWA|nr:hypothetical protein NDU88_006912 [Pleurodeles waltl]